MLMLRSRHFQLQVGVTGYTCIKGKVEGVMPFKSTGRYLLAVFPTISTRGMHDYAKLSITVIIFHHSGRLPEHQWHLQLQ